MKKIVVSVFFVMAAFVEARAQKAEVFSPGGKAIRGYDAVAFFTEGKPVMGADSLAYTWHGAVWLFVSQEHLDRFKAAPEKYAPQYGGYCAYGCSQGHKAPTEIDTWSIVNDKLYFNYNKKVQAIWVKDQPGYVLKADKEWTTLKDKD